MDIKVKAFSEYERYKKECIVKPFKSMGNADWFVAGFLAASSTSSNNKYTAPQATPKSCLNCKYKCTGYTNAMCVENEYCDYEPA